MQKKILVCVAGCVVALAAIAAVVLYRHRGGDIIGVTTYAEKNTVIMNSSKENEFVQGTGHLTLKEGEHFHLEHSLTAGSFDIYFISGKDDVVESLEKGEYENLPTPEELSTEEAATGQSGVEGKGSLDFEAEPGDYTVCFVMHGGIGKATASVKAAK